MTRKFFFATIASLVLVFTSVAPVAAKIQTRFLSSQVTLSEEIPNEVIILACQAVEKEKIATTEVALCWYRAGILTITKINSGVYSVTIQESGGSGVVELLIDAL